MRGTEPDFLNKDMINFFKDQKKNPQTILLYASICANFSSHSLFLLASMFPIYLRISRGEIINLFAPLWCCSFSTPPEQCHQNWLLTWAEESPSSCTSGLWASVQLPFAFRALNGPDQLPWAFPATAAHGPGPHFDSAWGLQLQSCPCLSTEPVDPQVWTGIPP